MERLLRATMDVLEEKGLEGATIPRIAARAGLSAGAVYRRFPDKDALLRTAMLEMWEKIDEQTARFLTPDLAKRTSLKFFAEQMVRNSLLYYRRYPGLLRALIQFFRTHPSEAFRRKVDEVEVRTVRRIVDFLMHHRAEIKHSAPEAALAFSILLVGSILREIILMGCYTDIWKPLLPASDDDLVQEVTRVMMNYLGAATKSA